jgi:hypothetical protein
LPGVAVSRRWESSNGAAAAALRRAVMSRPAPSKEPEAWEQVPWHLRDEWTIDPAEQRRELLTRHDELADKRRSPRRRTERV